MQLLAVYTTVATLDDARAMAAAVVQRRLAACAQIEPIESYYTWNGAVQHEPEFRILFKTTASRYAPLAALIRELHRYDLPAIHALAVDEADPAYAAWVAEGSAGDDQAV